MVIYCCVPECTSFGNNGMHRFPTDSEKRKKWMEATKTDHLILSSNTKMCRKHFKESDLLTDIDGKLRLVGNAVPCLFLPSSLTLDLDHNYGLV